MPRPRIAFTTVSYNDRETLKLVVKSIVEHTTFDEPVLWYMALQNCSQSFVNDIVGIISTQSNIILVLARFQENIGLSNAMTYLVEQTKYIEYTLNIEDDWILLPSHIPSKLWLHTCLQFLTEHKDITAVFLRAYKNDRDKHQYGWTRTIPYRNHKHDDNFNYEQAMQRNKHIVTMQEMDKDVSFQLIPNFLFSFNPVLVRNADYHKHVYPLPRFDKDQKDPQFSSSWGFCEALAMERTRDAGLLTYWFEKGVFGHYEDFFPPPPH